MTMAAESHQRPLDSPVAGGCEWCTNPLPPKSHSGGAPRRFCSDACRLKANAQRVVERKRHQRPLDSPVAGGRKRRPLTDAANDAAWALRKDIERLERIFADDRFGENKEKVAPLLRGHLSYTAQACQDLISRITPQQEG